MNIIDILLLVMVALSVWSGYPRGFLLGFAEILAWIGSLLLTFPVYPHVLTWLEKSVMEQSVWTVPIAFIATFLVIRILAGLVVGWILGAVPVAFHQNIVNRAFGVLPGLLNGFIYAALLATLLLIVPISDGLSEKARESRLAPRLAEPVAFLEDHFSPIFDDAVKRTISRTEVPPHSDRFVKLSYKVQHAPPRPDLEAEMLDLLNEERAEHGLQPLKADIEMREVARAHSVDMFARGYFSHRTPEDKSPFDRMKDRGVKFLTAGENLSLARSLIMAHEGLMHSPGHRANILKPEFGRVGIGIMDGGIYGIMVTQNFRN